MKEYNGVNILNFTPSEIGKLCKSIDGYAGIIYCYTNLVNGKRYIGQTIHPVDRHCSHIRNEYRVQDKTPFHMAIMKYGCENFKYNVLELCIAQTRDELQRELNNLEITLIAENNTRDKENGYNISAGGQLNDTFKGAPSPKPVDMFDMDGNFIRSFSSVSEAQNLFQLSGNGIQKVCNHEQTSSSGHLWAWEGELPVVPNKDVICQYDLKGNYVASYQNASQAALAVGAKTVSGLHAALKDKYRIGYGFYWRKYKTDKLPLSDFPNAIYSYNLYGEFLKGYITLADAVKDVQASGTSAICASLYHNKSYKGRVWRNYFKSKLDVDTLPSQGVAVKVDFPSGVTKIYYTILSAAKDNNWNITNLKYALKGNNCHQLSGAQVSYYNDSLDPDKHPEWIFVRIEETRDRQLYKPGSLARKVDQYSKDGKLVQTYNSIAEAKRANSTSNISSAIMHQQLCAGYIWTYHGETIPQKTIDYINAQKVFQYDQQGNYVGEFENRKAAALAIGYSSPNSHIGRCIKEPWRTAGGFYWRSFKTNKIDITEWDTKD